MDAFWKFVQDNISAGPAALRLKYHGKVVDFDIDAAITQIECRQKFGKKLSQTLALCQQWLFPSILAGEQSTSDLLADYHTTLAPDALTVIDLTAGLGIDASHYALKGANVTAIDVDNNKVSALNANAAAMNLDRLTALCADCTQYIRDTTAHYDVAFIDPARRASDGSRVFALTDCTPDVTAMLPDLRKIANTLIVKMSPMLDISSVISTLPGTTRIIALGTPTECKELIAVVNLTETTQSPVGIEAVTLTHDCISTLAFTRDEEDTTSAIFPERELSAYKYVCEPYPSVMKSAPWRTLCRRYNIVKIAPNTHLYLSDTPPADFPGTVWKIEKIVPYESRFIKRLKREYPRIQVTTRNFPTGAEALRTKLGVTDSEHYRLFACLTATNPVMIVTSRQL